VCVCVCVCVEPHTEIAGQRTLEVGVGKVETFKRRQIREHSWNCQRDMISSLSLPLSLTLSHSLTHTHTLSHTHSLSLSFSLSHTHTHSLSLTHTHTHTGAHQTGVGRYVEIPEAPGSGYLIEEGMLLIRLVRLDRLD
jgi:hypothetical protein